VTAASTPENTPFGYVFHNCRLTSDCPPRSVYLGRPWREWAKTVFISCEMGSHIHPTGWHDWQKPHGHFYYGEYASSGEGAAHTALDAASCNTFSKERAAFSHQLTAEEAALYTIENVLGAPDGWQP
ncbi:MAG: pectin methylesterase, partial [Lachnospiraceae bacterium]|nr:pectin methylesterase [Lachnospiraceae bacterium]